MVSGFELRPDHNCRQRLNELAEIKGVTAAEIVCQLIDQTYEEVMKEQRLRAAEELIDICAEVPPDPAELSRMMAQTLDNCGIC